MSFYLQEFMQYGSIPMQTNHMKQNYAAYLSSNFPMVNILKSLKLVFLTLKTWTDFCPFLFF